jgi:putative transposase
MVETVFRTIKPELISRTIYKTRSKGIIDVEAYIAGFYNPRRRPSALGYKSPITFESNPPEHVT